MQGRKRQEFTLPLFEELEHHGIHAFVLALVTLVNYPACNHTEYSSAQNIAWPVYSNENSGDTHYRGSCQKPGSQFFIEPVQDHAQGKEKDGMARRKRLKILTEWCEEKLVHILQGDKGTGSTKNGQYYGFNNESGNESS